MANERRWRGLGSRLTRVWAACKRVLTPSDAAWSAAALAVLALWGAPLLAFALFDVAPHFSFEKAVGLVGFYVLAGLLTLGAALLFWGVSALGRGYRWALLLALPPLTLFAIVGWGPKGFALLGALVLGSSLTAGGLVAAMRRRNALAQKRTPAVIVTAIGALLVGALAYGFLYSPADPNPAFAGYHLKGPASALADPGEVGPFEVETFTYGSGTDRHRPDYAKAVRFRTHSVDGSKLDAEWKGLGGALRSAYWGFGPDAFPLQGRVWAPKGNGPFPLVLIVHGNHAMEEPSDPGYAYLGELLASQGFIAVSVDENFINSSFSEMFNPFRRRKGDENDARAWLLLEHLKLWRKWTADAAHPLRGRADMSRIGLIGHSRGGEAVATAAAFNHLRAWPDDAAVKFDYGFEIRGVAAIAPVDGQYQARRRPTPLRDLDYFVLHGSLDGDMSSFMGAAQYARVDPGPDGFKAALYVKDANHGQFNTGWGRNDYAGTMGFMIDQRPIMDPLAQRQVAKVFLVSFLRASLREETGYRAVLADPRRGAAWLPDTYLAADFADGASTVLANFDEDLDPTTGAVGVGIGASNLSVWKETWGKIRWGDLDTHQAVLGWNNRLRKGKASYALAFARPPAANAEGVLVFSLSQSGESSIPPDLKGKVAADEPGALDWTVVLTDATGEEAGLPLSADQPLYPQIKGQTRRLTVAETMPTSEIVMRGYRLPLAAFLESNPRLDLSNLRYLRFDFDRSPEGSIVLDDMGIALPAGPRSSAARSRSR